MFNLFPGQGLGFSGSRELCFGLAPVIVYKKKRRGGGIVRMTDNAYSFDADDQEVMEILMVIFGVIE